MSEATDLTDWTEQEGGEDPSPEDAVKINLSRWFENHGATVYWEKRPSYGYQIFRTDGGADHPDLLVDGQYRTFAIEVKRGTEGSLIHDGIAQTKRYWSDYIQGTDYRLRSGSVTICSLMRRVITHRGCSELKKDQKRQQPSLAHGKVSGRNCRQSRLCSGWNAVVTSELQDALTTR